MFWRIFLASMRHEKARLSIAALAMTLGSMLISGLLNLSGDIGGQVGRELRAYGANLIIRPKERVLLLGSGALEFGAVTDVQTIAEADLERVKEVEGVMGVIPYLYTVVEVGSQPAILAGVDFPAARSINTWWQVQGSWPENPGDILVGRRASESLQLSPGETIHVTYLGENQTLRVSGVLETGGAEDEQLIASLPAVQAFTGQQGSVGLAMVSALPSQRSLDALVRELQARLPDAEVHTLAQFAEAEARVLDKVRLLIGLVAGLVLVAGALTVGGTLNTIVLERRVEIGLMKALGAAERRVAGLFFVETLAIGAIGGGFGYLLGLGLAVLIGWQVFETPLTPTVWGLPGTLVAAISVAWVAGLFPVRRALKIDPVKTLRGE